MITAKDIQKKKFEKVKFGYSPEEVDSFLSQIENDLRLMQQELDDSNEKIQLLADKVREYKDSEDDLKNALLLAQKQARQVVKDAEEKAAQIEADARASVDSVKSEAMLSSEEQLRRITEQLNREHANLVETKKQVADFKRSLFDMYKEHLELISALPEDGEEAEPAAPAQAAPAEAPAPEAASGDAAQSSFGSRRDDTRRDDKLRKRV